MFQSPTTSSLLVLPGDPVCFPFPLKTLFHHGEQAMPLSEKAETFYQNHVKGSNGWIEGCQAWREPEMSAILELLKAGHVVLFDISVRSKPNPDGSLCPIPEAVLELLKDGTLELLQAEISGTTSADRA
jgi:hypothetical protein